jgi:hypothetical protein
MIKNIQKAFSEITSLSRIKSTNLVSIWIMNYYVLYETTKKNYETLCEICKVLETQNLPYDCLLNPSYCAKITPEYRFINLYESVDEFMSIHKLESYCQVALQELNDLSPKEWLVKHYDIWEEKIFMFGVDYLDNDDESIMILDLIDYNNTRIELFIDRSNFKYLEEFSNKYNDMFYVNKLYPEKLDENSD